MKQRIIILLMAVVAVSAAWAGTVKLTPYCIQKERDLITFACEVDGQTYYQQMKWGSYNKALAGIEIDITDDGVLYWNMNDRVSSLLKLFWIDDYAQRERVKSVTVDAYTTAGQQVSVYARIQGEDGYSTISDTIPLEAVATGKGDNVPLASGPIVLGDGQTREMGIYNDSDCYEWMLLFSTTLEQVDKYCMLRSITVEYEDQEDYVPPYRSTNIYPYYGKLIGGRWGVDTDYVLRLRLSNLAPHTSPWKDACGDSIRHIVIEGENSLTSSYMFSELPSLLTADLGNTTYVDDWTFTNCPRLHTVTFNENLKSIGKGAFKDCPSLKEIDFRSVTKIGVSAFENCTALSQINLSKVETINGSAFEGCTSIETLDIPKSLQSIGGSAFKNCSGLKTINWLPVGERQDRNHPNLKEIGGQAFAGCTSLDFADDETILTIPATTNTLYLGWEIFKGCTALTSVRIGTNNKLRSGNEESNRLPNGMFQDCTNITWATMYGVQTIGANAFQNCQSLLAFEIYSSPNNLSIERLAFSDCVSLKYVDSNPYGNYHLISIGKEAFKRCRSLTSVSFSIRTTSVYLDAFSGCSSLSYIDASRASNLVWHDFYDSYVVKEMSRASFYVPLATLIFLPKENSVNIDADEFNVVIGGEGGTCNEFRYYGTLNRARFASPYKFTAAKAVYMRDFPVGVKSIFSLAFPLTKSKVNALGTVYEYNGVEDFTVKMKKTTGALTAHKIYALEAKSTSDTSDGILHNITATNVTVNAYQPGEPITRHEWTAQRDLSIEEYEELEEGQGAYGLLAEKDASGVAVGRFVLITDPETIDDYLAYLVYRPSTAAARSSSMAARRASDTGTLPAELAFEWDEEETAIQSINVSPAENDNPVRYYDLQGRRVMNPTKGIYIVGGRKTVVR